MQARKHYLTPTINSEELKIGVFGNYGGTGKKFPGDGSFNWWSGWWDFFFGRRRRR